MRINLVSIDGGTKSKEQDVHYAVIHVGDLNSLPRRIQKTDTLKVVNVNKGLTNRIDDAFLFTLHSAGRYSEIRHCRYGQIEKRDGRRRRRERERIRRKKRIAIIDLRYGSELMDGGTIVRIVNSLLPTAVT